MFKCVILKYWNPGMLKTWNSTWLGKFIRICLHNILWTSSWKLKKVSFSISLWNAKFLTKCLKTNWPIVPFYEYLWNEMKILSVKFNGIGDFFWDFDLQYFNSFESDLIHMVKCNTYMFYLLEWKLHNAFFFLSNL